MWRGSGSQRRATKKDDEAESQMIAVAIDADKNSQHALKWAADHLVTKGQILFMLHVRRKINTITTPTGQQLTITEVGEEVQNSFLEQLELQSKELLLPFQCFCSGRGGVDKLVLGASSRSLLTRTFKQADVPSTVSKIAPDFCSVYVIAKGKISSVRPATHQNTNQSRRQEFENGTAANHFQSIKSEPEVRNLVMSSKSRIPIHSNYSMNERNNVIVQPSTKYLNSSFKSVASCPSLSRGSFEKSINPYLRETLDSVSRQTRFAPLHNETSYGYEQKKNFDMNSMDGPQWSNISSDSTNEAKEEATTSWCSSSPSVEGLDELNRLKMVLNNKVNLIEKLYIEDHNNSVESNIKNSWGIPMPTSKNSSFETAQTAERNLRDQHVLKEADNSIVPDSFASLRYRKYTNEEIQKATNNYSAELKIGEGGYGPVYKATLDHTLVAIKVLSSNANQGMKQFQKEVQVLSCMRHPHMVLLMGACPESGCLVYEYMANGSLEDRLFCHSGTAPLSWQLRFKLAAEIASGLLFLHQTKPEPLVHRDLKPANILLDHNFVGKIADVGLARLIPPDTADTTTQLHMTAAAGTFCYIDPEYQKTGMVSTKSDIYALGIILLQLVAGRQPMGLAYNVDTAMDSGKLGALLDPKVTDWPMEETIILAKLGLQCCELKRKDRPDLASVVLTELNKLRDFAAAALGHSFLQHQQRSRSYKEPYGVS